MGRRLIPESDTRISELDFDLNGFKKQKIYRGVEAYAKLIERLIRQRKGSMPSDPDMGVGLDTYRFMDIDVLVADTLRSAIRSQIDKYIPGIPLQSVDVSVARIGGRYILYVTISLLDNTVIRSAYAQDKNGAIVKTKIEIEQPKLINVPTT